MWTHPGKKLLFMGGEFGQWREWSHEESLEWHLLQYAPHLGLQHWLKDLNQLYREAPALYQRDFTSDGFEWVDLHDWQSSIVSYLRYGSDRRDCLLVVCNLTPVVRDNYRVGVPRGGYWRERLNSDAALYGGGNLGNGGGVHANPVAAHGRFQSLNLLLPPLSVLVFEAPPEGG
jgi:1,4-alpha-glucan branching enzyme